VSQFLHRISAASILQGLVWGVLMLLALALPLIEYSLDLEYQRGTLASEGQARAFVIGQRVAANPQLWAFETLRLEEHLRQNLLDNGQADHRSILDARGEVVAQHGDESALSWPVLEERQALYENGRVAGWVRLKRSLRGDVLEALGLGAASLGLGTAAALLLTRLPLRRLRTMEEELRHKAYHDALTGLYNRDAFRRLMASAVALARRDGKRLAVLFIDLDRFKSINDSLGHDAGDEALRGVAERLRAGVRAEDVVARLSGDEFAILMEAPQTGADRLAETILQSFETHFIIGGRHWHLGCSVGVALYPQHGDDPDRLLACADTAMLNAKAAGRSASRLYHETMEESVAYRAQIEEDLRGALERGEFLLHYQPLIDLASGTVKGSEALLRWQHPQRGLVPPVEFIPTLEEMGMIHAVGQWVLDEACAQMRRWLDEGLPMRQVSVNVSPRQFARQDDFVDGVRAALGSANLDGVHLQLELTEGTLMINSVQSQKLLGQLRRLDVELAIDDFGTGYSSLAYLRTFPVSVLKIDRSFVSDMLISEGHASIVKAVVQMAHSLNLKVTAEGIETEAQQRALEALGCDTGQGYKLGRPMPAQDLASAVSRARSTSGDLVVTLPG
jgi:diguanylate cyclase (GGDEF)-like protein